MGLLSLPTLSDRIAELVFTHKSYYHAGYPSDESPRDWERLAFVGEGVLFSTISKLLYRLLPMKKAAALKRGRVKLMSKECLAIVTDQYGWMKHIRCSEGDRANVVQSVDNRAAVVESYIGGIALELGSAPAEEWAEDLVITVLRRFIIEEGVDVGVVMQLVEKVNQKRSAPPPSSAMVVHAKMELPEGDSKPKPKPPTDLDRMNAAARNSDVDGDPMDMMDIDGQSSESEALSKPALPPAYTSHQVFSSPSTVVSSPPPTSTSAMVAYQQPPPPSQTQPTAYPNTLNPAHLISIYDPSLFIDNALIATSSSQYPPSNYLSSQSTSPRSIYSHGSSTPTPTPPQRPLLAIAPPRPASMLVDKSSILKGALAKLNERAKTKFTQPEWKLTSEGQGQHTVWTAKLFLQSKGYICEAQGQSKQIAKELAAKAALEKLNWTDRPW
ncbi:hypothetical protein FRB98_001648 [Tulasnella sp. 332]|nr:hypothetical protein FRB98_001648 [Tulasnella sp. 332]